MMLRQLKTILQLSLLLVTQSLQAQTTFTRITDTSNPIVTDSPPPGYPGASWIDYDNDGKLDLSITGVTPNYLYRNLGNGNFSRTTTIIGLTQPIAAGSGGGHSWADYNNDGLLDVCVTGEKTFIYRNDGAENFTRIAAGVPADSSLNAGWACSWGDYDQDGDVDLLVVNAAGFLSTSNPNIVLRNGGPPNYTFTKIDTGAIVSQGLQAYTVGSFVDYDLDNDLDCFIGSGPVTAAGGLDYMHQNMKSETGTAFYRRIITAPFATQIGDGQNWNWIDIDNDGDLDGYVTNYGGNGPGSLKQNHLYRNDNGTYVRVTSGAIVTDQFISLANVWGDCDNDGDIDCIVANEGPATNNYYDNNGNGTFTSVTTGDLVTNSANHRTATLGDYDNDGDLDLFVAAPGQTGKALYRNDLSNGNKWINVQCVGAQSDKAGIGTKIRAKATINGQAKWQIREVSSQNSFCGANMLNVHFGFGNAAVIDSLEIRWERGSRQVFTNVVPNRFYRVTEGGSLTPVTGVKQSDGVIPTSFSLEQNYPNPFNPTTKIVFSIPVGTRHAVSLQVFDVLGKEVQTLVQRNEEAGSHEVDFDASNLASGVYYYRLVAGSFAQTKKMILTR